MGSGSVSGGRGSTGPLSLGPLPKHELRDRATPDVEMPLGTSTKQTAMEVLIYGFVPRLSMSPGSAAQPLMAVKWARPESSATNVARVKVTSAR